MLRITIPAIELYDEINEEFISSKEQQLQLEHSLVSLSKWEAKWCKPFLTKENKTFEEVIISSKEVIDIDGYNYNSVDKDSLTITTGEFTTYYKIADPMEFRKNLLENNNS